MSFLPLNAQRHNGGKNFDPARYKAEMEQFIVREACLTPQEASVFFPIFDEMKRKERTLRNHISALRRVKPATEQGCAEAVRKRDALEIQIKELQQQYHNRLSVWYCASASPYHLSRNPGFTCMSSTWSSSPSSLPVWRASSDLRS